jgi:hypothetical protein
MRPGVGHLVPNQLANSLRTRAAAPNRIAVGWSGTDHIAGDRLK